MTMLTNRDIAELRGLPVEPDNPADLVGILVQSLNRASLINPSYGPQLKFHDLIEFWDRDGNFYPTNKGRRAASEVDAYCVEQFDEISEKIFGGN